MEKEAEKYENEILNLFNVIRTKPQSFCKHIDNAIDYITTNPEGKQVIGVEKTSKIVLKYGIPKFNETKRFLLNMKTLNALKPRDELKLDIPEDPNLWLNNELLRNLIVKKQEELSGKYTKFGFHFDYAMIDPSLSAVLQVVDDNNCGDKRRENIVNEEFKYVGISHRAYGKKFCSYFLFAG